MTRTQTILLTMGVLVIIGGIISYSLFKTVTPVQQVQTNVGLPVADQTTFTQTVGGTQQADRLPLAVMGGGTIVVNNFLKDPQTAQNPLNRDYFGLNYSIDQRGSAITQSPFIIMYIASTQYFNIELLQEPLGQVRELAQQYLEQRLGISAFDLCRLNYTVGTPSNVSQLYGGINLGFSFCTGATKLPQ